MSIISRVGRKVVMNITKEQYEARMESKSNTDQPHDPEYTGGSSSYYKVRVKNPTSGGAPYMAECNDIIEALELNYADANIFKAIWRIAAAKQGKQKQGHNERYDREKIRFFNDRYFANDNTAGND